MSLEKIISDKLNGAFKPLELQVENESSQHQGHAGDDGQRRKSLAYYDQIGGF